MDAGRGWITRYFMAENQPGVSAAPEQAVRAKAPVDLEHRWQKPDMKIAWMRMRAW